MFLEKILTSGYGDFVVKCHTMLLSRREDSTSQGSSHDLHPAHLREEGQGPIVRQTLGGKHPVGLNKNLILFPVGSLSLSSKAKGILQGFIDSFKYLSTKPMLQKSPDNWASVPVAIPTVWSSFCLGFFICLWSFCLLIITTTTTTFYAFNRQYV